MTIATIIFSILTLIVLIVGIFIMGKSSDKKNSKLSNKLMTYRVIFQALAILCLAIVMFLGVK